VASENAEWLSNFGKPLATVAGEQKKLISSPAPFMNNMSFQTNLFKSELLIFKQMPLLSHCIKGFVLYN